MLLTTTPRIRDQAEAALHCSFWLPRISTSNTLSSFVLSLSPSLSALSRERAERDSGPSTRPGRVLLLLLHTTRYVWYVRGSDVVIWKVLLPESYQPECRVPPKLQTWGRYYPYITTEYPSGTFYSTVPSEDSLLVLWSTSTMEVDRRVYEGGLLIHYYISTTIHIHYGGGS